MKDIRKWKGLLIGIGLCGILVSCFSQSMRRESKAFKGSSNAELRYLVYKPKNFKSEKSYPLLVYLHGSGSIGNNLDLVRQSGLPFLIEEEGLDLPFIVIAPQLSPNGNNQWPAAMVNEFIKHAIANHSIEINKIYLTGFSMGGAGVWDYAMAYPSVIACAVPIAGWGNTQMIFKMKNIPTWIFHGMDDNIVSLKGSQNLSNKLKAYGGEVTLTELKGVDHEAWRNVYHYPGLFDWMIAKNKADTVKRKVFTKVNEVIKAYKLPKALYQVTGIAYSSEHEFYGVAAKNAQPLLFNFDTLGHIKKMIKVSNASNLSWQDLTFSEGYLYVADVGNEGRKRKFFQVYKIKHDDIINKELVEAEKIEFQLSAGNSLHFKSMFKMNNYLYFFGETAQGDIHLIKINDQPGQLMTATDLGDFSYLHTGTINSAVFNPKTEVLYLLNKKSILEISLTSNDVDLREKLTFSATALTTESAKEGLALLSNKNIAFADQNFLGTTDGNLYILTKK